MSATGEDLQELSGTREIVAAIAALVCAASAFLPWYRQGSQTFTAWATGAWGPLLVFAGGSALALMALQRAGSPAALPFGQPAVVAGLGAIAFIGAVVKALIAPTVALAGTHTFVRTDRAWGIAAGIAGSAALAIAGISGGGRSYRPGWLAAARGWAGAALLGVPLGAAIAFGLVNSAPGVEQPRVFQRSAPECIKTLPILDGMQPDVGYSLRGGDLVCSANYTTASAAPAVAAAYERALRAAGWTFQVTTPAGGHTSFVLTKPRCGTASISRDTIAKRTRVLLSLTACRD